MLPAEKASAINIKHFVCFPVMVDKQENVFMTH